MLFWPANAASDGGTELRAQARRGKLGTAIGGAVESQFDVQRAELLGNANHWIDVSLLGKGGQKNSHLSTWTLPQVGALPKEETEESEQLRAQRLGNGWFLAESEYLRNV